MSGTWVSPYMHYIHSLRVELGIHTAYRNSSFWKGLTMTYFLDKCNASLVNYTCVNQLTGLERSRHVCENEFSTVITQFKFDHAGLGNKAPRPGYQRKPFCPLCPTHHKTSCYHILFVCSSISSLRATTGIQAFITTATIKGVSLDTAYKHFVNGLDLDEKPVDIKTYFERAKCMSDMRHEWLSKW